MDVELQPRRRQVVSGGTGIEGSSESDSGSGGYRASSGAGRDTRGPGKLKTLPLVAMGFAEGGASSGDSDGRGGSGFGVSSMVECFPVVQGSIERNSSNVKNRGLQHFQPIYGVSQCLLDPYRPLRGRPDTFLSFMKYRWSRMVDAFFFRICKSLSTPLVHTVLGHVYTKD